MLSRVLSGITYKRIILKDIYLRPFCEESLADAIVNSKNNIVEILITNENGSLRLSETRKLLLKKIH